VRYNCRRAPSPEGSSNTREIDLAAAISEIKQTCDEAEDGKPPFLVIAGAGISVPFVPLASGIIQDCKGIAAKYNRTSEPPSKSPLDIYSHWFESAFPQAIQRQRYFKKLIAGKPISHANLRLAHLLSEKRLATLVVTPNFDDFLSRALTLFGQSHIVCDQPNNLEQIHVDSPDLQIVHVHGTFRFYDLCNSKQDIRERAADSRDQVMTMTSLLDDSLIRYSPVVMGYSGWEGDTIMTALVRRLKGRLPNNLHWFCYRRSDADALPDWLKNHRDVRIVLPPLVSPNKPDSQSADPQPPPEAKLTGILTESEPTLTAQSVLDKLVEALTGGPPSLTRDPIGFFADQLRRSFAQDFSENTSEDIYGIRDVLRRVEMVRDIGEKKPNPVEAEMERVRDAVRRSAYLEALQAAGELETKLTSNTQREMLMESAGSAAVGLNDDSEAELGGYELVLRLATEDTGTSPQVQGHTAKALYNKAVALGHLNRREEALEAYNEMLRRFGDSTEPVLRERVAKALHNKGGTLGQLSRREEALKAYNETLRRFGEATEPALRWQAARALYGKAFSLGRLGRNDEATQTADELMNRLGDTPDAAMRTLFVDISLEKSLALARLERHNEAIQTYDEVLRRFGDATEPKLREQVARTVVNKGIVLGQLNRHDEAAKTYDEVLHRFGDATELVAREQVATALVYRGRTLNTLKRPQEAKSSFQEVLRRFADSPESGIQQRVEEAKAELKSMNKANP
jgi:tetratricopeptide (TPR) repeat protein